MASSSPLAFSAPMNPHNSNSCFYEDINLGEYYDNTFSHEQNNSDIRNSALHTFQPFLVESLHSNQQSIHGHHKLQTQTQGQCEGRQTVSASLNTPGGVDRSSD